MVHPSLQGVLGQNTWAMILANFNLQQVSPTTQYLRSMVVTPPYVSHPMGGVQRVREENTPRLTDRERRGEYAHKEEERGVHKATREYTFPGFCTGCQRQNGITFCYGCDRDPTPQLVKFTTVALSARLLRHFTICLQFLDL